MLRSSSSIVKTFIGYAAAEQHRCKYLCFYCGGSLIIESDAENQEYGVVECLLCTRLSAVIKPEDWKKKIALPSGTTRCEKCGESFPCSDIGRTPKFCSKSCRQSAWSQGRSGRVLACLDCHTDISHLNYRRKFCDACIMQHDRERKQKYQRPSTLTPREVCLALQPSQTSSPSR